MYSNELLNKISKTLVIKNNINICPDDIKLVKINKETRVYEIPCKNIKILYFKKSGNIMINSNKENKLA